jgi:bifunctional DNA-binding transcriptional regulator/antitoxin component of YhaV-PrlF toxin-antitoxin module
MRFHATLEQGGKTATGIHVPDEVVAALGSSRRPAVRVTLGGHTYRTTVASMRGRFLVPVSAAVREAAGVAAGDELDVEIELDTEPREVAVPDDLAAALAAVPAARERFDRLAYSHRKEHVRAIEEAKTEATRQRRIAKTVEVLTP